MDVAAQFLVAGIGLGSLYALFAYGVSLVWSVSRTLNFAHGEMVMAGVFASIVALSLGASPVSSILTAAGLSAVLGLCLYKGVYQPLSRRGSSPLVWVLGIVVFAALVRDVSSLVFETGTYPAPIAVGGDGLVSVGSVVFRAAYVWVFLISAGAAAAMEWTIARTSFGRAVRATAASRETAELMGIHTEKVTALVFVAAAVLGTLAGILIAPLTFVSVSFGWVLTMKGFTAAVLGGLGRGKGALVGGLLLGVFEQLLTLGEFAASDGASHLFAAGYRDAAIFLLLILVLVWRPSGLVPALGTDTRGTKR